MFKDNFDTPNEDIDEKVVIQYEDTWDYVEGEADVERFVKAIEAAERAGVLETQKSFRFNDDWKDKARVQYDEEEETYGSGMSNKVSAATEDYEELQDFTEDTELMITYPTEWEREEY